ncbi:MAG TPA: Ig-like domain-containing protein [Longimicrobium sp.]|nr:Ig-like domain-containing protein [Longimicrobium sp.]
MKRLLLAALPAALLLAACGDGPTGTAAVASVSLAPDGRTLAVGETLALEAVVRDVRGGAPEDPEVDWSSDAPGVATVDAQGVVTAVAVGTANVRAEVDGKSASVRVAVAALPPECGPGGAVRSLAVGEAAVLGGVSAHRLCVDGGAAGKEYVLVPFNGNGDGEDFLTLTFQTQGTVPVLAASPARVPSRLADAFAAPARDDEWAAKLRERTFGELAPRAAGARAALRDRISVGDGGPRLATPRNVSVGDQLTLNATVTRCEDVRRRTGRVVAVTQHAVVVADAANPAGGLTDAEYRALGEQFDALAWPVVTGAFGLPEDVDDNGRVLIFFTRAVNELTPPGSGSYVGGFFHPRDLFPTRNRDRLEGCEGSNYAEMFYMLAADPSGEVNNNPRSKELVLRASVATLAHELQHLVNASRRLYTVETDFYNEEKWLNEGLSHIAEELVFYAATGLAPRQNLSSAEILATPARQDAFARYLQQNFQRYSRFLVEPDDDTPLGEGPDDDDLATRGAAWVFLRYAADRRGGAEGAFWKALVDNDRLGIDNLQAALGTDPRLWVRDWTTSVFTDDAVPGVEARFTQPSWNFRATYATYPLNTIRIGANGSAAAGLFGGSGSFIRFGVPAAGTGSITVREGSGPPPSAAFVTIVRTR